MAGRSRGAVLARPLKEIAAAGRIL
jgi:hypothetical protein